VTRNEEPVVLIAEDDPNHLALLRRAVEQTGYRWPCYCVSDGEEAIGYLSGRGKFGNRREFPLPSIFLLDLKMPGKNGFEVLEWLRDQMEAVPGFKNMRTVVLTASDEIRDVNRAYQLGAASFLVKPVEFSEFREMVGASLRYWTALNAPGTVSAAQKKVAKGAR
jgi:CheY-like chemotaxis protein